MSSDIRIAICTPSGENVKAGFHTCMFSFILRSKVPICHVFNEVSSRITWNRNNLVVKAKGVRASHILWVDADMVDFTPDMLVSLVAHDRDIIGLTAARRVDGFDDAIGITLDGSRLRVPSLPVKMKMIGMPFMLVKMDVYEKLRAPWFAEPPWWMLGKQDDEGVCPEDEYFCMRAIEAGYDVWCDIESSMTIGHRGEKTYRIMKPQEEIIFYGNE